MNRPLLMPPGLKEFADALRKAFDEAKHPRQAAGSSEGGQFADKPGGLTAKQALLDDLQAAGWRVERDVERIYWHDIFLRSIAMRSQIDPRTKGRRKPLLLERGDETVLIEWDYGNGQWLAWDDRGGILRSGKTQFDVLLNLVYGPTKLTG